VIERDLIKRNSRRVLVNRRVDRRRVRVKKKIKNRSRSSGDLNRVRSRMEKGRNKKRE
jgi:hypothetical protein